MSDLEQIRRHAHDNIERLAAASAIVELDNEAMRGAIIDALSIYDQDDALSGYGPGSTARRMARRLRELSRVPAEVLADAEAVEREPGTTAHEVLEGWKADPTSSVFGGEPEPREHGDDLD